MADERKPGETFKVPEMSNVRADGSVSEDMDLHTLNLKSNFLWHSDSTFLPTPALVNVITARILPTSGGRQNWPQRVWDGPPCQKSEGTDKRARDLAPLQPFAQENFRRTFKAADVSQMA